VELAQTLPRPARADAFRLVAAHKSTTALLLALTIFGAVYGFATTLNVGSSPLAAGNASVASCQAAGSPTGAYTVAYDPALGSYGIAGITVKNLDAGCAAKTVSVTLTGAANAILATISGVVPAGGGSLALSPGTAVAAANVTGVSVGING
jgi:hypothetical protein